MMKIRAVVILLALAYVVYNHHGKPFPINNGPDGTNGAAAPAVTVSADSAISRAYRQHQSDVEVQGKRHGDQGAAR